MSDRKVIAGEPNTEWGSSGSWRDPISRHKTRPHGTLHARSRGLQATGYILHLEACSLKQNCQVRKTMPYYITSQAYTANVLCTHRFQLTNRSAACRSSFSISVSRYASTKSDSSKSATADLYALLNNQRS